MNFLKTNKQPNFRIQQWKQAFFKEKCLTIDEITTFPVDLRNAIIQNFGHKMLPLEKLMVLKDEQACKYLFQLEDGERIESVYMHFQDGIKSLCISTQVGCPCSCAFCATGSIGFKRNLTTAEILAQVIYINKITEGIDRITVMGMGEAFLNPNIFEALKLLTSSEGLGFSAHRISVSTVGIVPGIRKLTQLFPQVTLTFSLHFPEQVLREQWMPTAKKYTLDEIFDALDERVSLTKRKMYLAYTVIDGVNNRKKDIDDLAKWIKARENLAYLYHINLIPYHAIHNLDIVETPRKVAVQMQKKLERLGIESTVRQSFGKSIKGACGQLAAGYNK